MKRGRAPRGAVLRKETDAELLLCRQVVAVRTHETSELVGNMSDRHIRSDESNGHAQRLDGHVCSADGKHACELLFDLGSSRESLATGSYEVGASAAYHRVAALASCLVDASVISSIIFLIASSSARLISISGV